jgi:hypothetical protein
MNEDQDMVFNKKCLPYLVKNYGFHTVIWNLYKFEILEKFINIS